MERRPRTNYNSRGGYNAEASFRGGRPKFGDARDFNRGGFRGGQGRGGYSNQGGDRKPYNKENAYGGRQDREGGYKKPAFNDHQSFSGNGGGFAKKPSNSLVACSVNPEDAKVQKIQFFTNQFGMRMGPMAPQQVYQYPIGLFESLDTDTLMESQAFTTTDVEKIVERERSRIELLVGKDFIFRGFNIWTRQRLEETFTVESRRMGKKVFLKIDHEGEYVVNTQDIDNPHRADCQAMSQILNVICKDAMSELGML